MKFSEQQIDGAVAWWCAALGRPKYDALGGERDQPMEMAQVMMSTFGARLTVGQILAFAAHLRDVLSGRCDHTWTGYTGATYPIHADRCLSVDYDPDVVLRHCGEIAGFPPAFFWPIKTTMWLTADDRVQVRYGYGAEIVDVTAKGTAKNHLNELSNSRGGT